MPATIWTHLWFKGDFVATVHGRRFRMFHNGSQIENEVFWRGTFEHERGTIKVAAELLPEMHAFIDVGANTGIFSLLAKATDPKIKVIAVEPSPANLAILRMNVALNAFDIAIEDAAATSTDGEIILHDFPDPSYSASLEADWREGTVERTVRGTTLDSLASASGASGAKLLVKIDVEGHEVAVLEGARNVISSGPSFLIEIIREHVARGVTRLLPPDDFTYQFINERTGDLNDATDKARKPAEMALGNYLVRPASRLKGTPAFRG